MPQIKPTPGRIVWYHPHVPPGAIGALLAAGQTDADLPHISTQPLAAIVAFVHGDGRLVNLTVFDVGGLPHPRLHVWLHQDGDGMIPLDKPFCEWMPYQKGQAAKTESLERQIGQVP